MPGVTAFPSTSIIDSGVFGRSLLQTAAASDARTLINIPGTANNFTAVQNFTGLNATPIRFTIEPDRAVDTESAKFNFMASSHLSDSLWNFVVRMGHNIGPNGSPIDTSKAVIGTEYEQSFRLGGKNFAEHHDVFWTVGATEAQRYTSFYARSDGPPANSSENQYGFKVDSLYHYNRTGATPYWFSDADGFVAQVPGEFRPSLRVYTPDGTSQNAVAFSIAYAGANTSTFRARGGLILNPHSTHTDYSLTCRNGAAGLGPLSVLAADGTPLLRMNNSGHIQTNQRVAATTLGSVTGRIAIYEPVSGTLVGYLPLYNTIT